MGSFTKEHHEGFGDLVRYQHTIFLPETHVTTKEDKASLSKEIDRLVNRAVLDWVTKKTKELKNDPANS